MEFNEWYCDHVDAIIEAVREHDLIVLELELVDCWSEAQNSQESLLEESEE